MGILLVGFGADAGCNFAANARKSTDRTASTLLAMNAVFKSVALVGLAYFLANV